MITASFERNFTGWREAAREFAQNQVPPLDIDWNEDAPSLFAPTPMIRSSGTATPNGGLKVPGAFIRLAETVACARDADRWSLLYRLLFRLNYENPNLLHISVDPDVLRAELLRKSVSRDIHKMHAFVRFKKVIVKKAESEEEIYLAWHRPEHLIIQVATPFFARRFGDRRWSIFTPDGSAHWDLENLQFGPGMEQNQFQAKDEWDEIWKTYYKSIFNPARIKIKAMKMEMATKYWSSMPETALIAELVRGAPQRLQTMAKGQNRAAEVAPNLPLKELRAQARICRACPLHAQATQTIFGEGPDNAGIMIIGEQPGDQEDLIGRPFVGPAGDILEQALARAGLSRENIYLTNAVKHFKWTPRGKVRLHQKPSGVEMHACKPWLDAEIARVKPQVIVALGATAATAILGRLPKISAERGKLRTDLKVAPGVVISWHPAAILRASDEHEAETRRQELAEDLKLSLSFFQGRASREPSP